MSTEAPEKIYVHVRANKELGIIWHGKKITNSDIEYTRTDAFIEKAFEFLGEHLWEYTDAKNANCVIHIRIDGDKLKEDFRKYIKGE